MNPKRDQAVESEWLEKLPPNSVVFHGEGIFEIFIDLGFNFSKSSMARLEDAFEKVLMI